VTLKCRLCGKDAKPFPGTIIAGTCFCEACANDLGVKNARLDYGCDCGGEAEDGWCVDCGRPKPAA
jgi:hypothetical protein